MPNVIYFCISSGIIFVFRFKFCYNVGIAIRLKCYLFSYRIDFIIFKNRIKKKLFLPVRSFHRKVFVRLLFYTKKKSNYKCDDIPPYHRLNYILFGIFNFLLLLFYGNVIPLILFFICVNFFLKL